MDFHGMDRKNLQILCKKHGIPANLKNTEMANRLASLFQKEDEDEETVTETKISREEEEDSVEAEDDGIKEEEEVVASRKAKKVRFSPETDNQVFEFTRSVKKNVRTLRRSRQDGAGKAPQPGGSIELRRSKRSVCNGYVMSGIVEDEKGPSNSVKVTRRSNQIGSRGSSVKEEGKDTDLIALEQLGDKGIQGGRRSTRLAGKTEGGTSKTVALLPAAKRSKRIGFSGGAQDTDLNALERVEGKDTHGGRRSRRLAAKAKIPCVEGGASKRVVDVANQEDERETGEQLRKDGDSKVEMVRRRSMRFVNEETDAQDQRRSVRLKAKVEKTLMGQAMSKLKNDTVKATRVVKGSLVDKKTDEKSSKRVTRNMKRDRSGEPGVDSGTASNQSNLTPKKTLDDFVQFEQEEACGADVKAGGSSKKSKGMNQECIEDKPQGIIIIEDSSPCSQTKAAESGMVIEKVFNPTLDKSDDSSQRSLTREINCERIEGECEEKFEQDKEEVSPRSLSCPKDKLHFPTDHILAKGIVSTVMEEENTKTKDESLIHSPESVLKEHSPIAKLANVEEILENSAECWKDIHSGKGDEKGSLEKDVQAENLHGNVSGCNTENSGAEEIEISKIGVMSVAHCVNLTPEKNLGEYAQLEPEEAGRPNEEASSSSQKTKKTVAQEFVKDKPQEIAEDSPSTSETEDTKPVVVSENVLDSAQKVSGYTSVVRNSHELNSELLEEGREEKHEQATPKKENGDASEFRNERSEVKTCPDNRSTGCSLSVETALPLVLAMRNPEADLGLPTGDDVVSAVITEEDKITKEETLIFTPASELKEHSSVAELAKVEAIQANSAVCCKEDEKGSLEKDVQTENLHGNFSECNTENGSEDEEMEISKDSYMSVNLSPEKLVDTYTQLVPEEAGGPNVERRSSSRKMKTVSSEFVKENPQGLVQDSPSTFVTKTAETIMISENVSVDISPAGRNTQELNPELMDDESEEKQELDIVLGAETEKAKKKASSPSEFLVERPEVSILESELFVETTPPPPSSVQIAVSNPESEQSVPTGHIIVKTEEVPKSVHSFVAKLADAEAFLEASAECWNESLSSKDDERGSLEKEKQSAKRHRNFSAYNAENSSAEEQADICKVGRISDGHSVDRETVDEVKDESLMKSVQTKSSERGCKPNSLELSGSLSHSYKEENVSECLEEEEMKALSQPIPIYKAASNTLDMSFLFTTPERNLMLMEKLSETGKIRAASIVTQHNDEAVESHDVVFTTPEQVLLLGDSGLDEEEQTATGFPDEPDILNTSRNKAFDEGKRIVVELHDESNIAASPLRQSSVGDFKEDGTERNEENRTVELHCEFGTCTGPDKHAALANPASVGAENSGGDKSIESCEESVAFLALEERHELFEDFGKDKAIEDEVKMDAQFCEEAGLSTEMHKDLPLADPELGEAGWLGRNNDDMSGSLEGQLLYGDSEQNKAVNPAEKAAAEFHDVSAVPNIPVRHPFSEESELDEATKSEESNALELLADCNNFTGANVTAKSHGMSDVLTASDNHSLMGDSKPDEEENKDVELFGESNISTDVERHLQSEEFGLAETREIKYNTAAICEESSDFISPERRQHLENSEPKTAGKQEQKGVEFKDESAFFTRLEARLLLGESGQERLGNGKSGSAQYQSHRASSPKVILKDDSVARERKVAAPDFRESTIADSSGSIASKVSYSHETSAEEETAGAEFMPRASQAENVVGLDAYVLALPSEGDSVTTGEISNHIEVAGTCSLVSEESGPSIDIQNQIHDAVEELARTDEFTDEKLTKNTQSSSKTISLPAEGDSETIAGTCSMVSEKSSPYMDIQNHIYDALEEELAVTDNNKADELTEAKVTKNVDSSGGSDVSGKTCVLAGTEDGHLCYNSEVTEPVDTAFEKDISLTPDESILQKNRNEEATDNEMLKRQATPSPEQTLNESGTSSARQVRREPILIYRTQMKPKRHDMKENAPNSKIVDNLNVTAPRTSKRQPLQDLRKN